MNSASPELSHIASNTERGIIGGIIAYAMGRKWAVSVNDGEEWTVKASTDPQEIAAAIGTTCETVLSFRLAADPAPKAEWLKLGVLVLMHGNDEDVIHDHTDNDDMAALARAVDV